MKSPLAKQPTPQTNASVVVLQWLSYILWEAVVITLGGVLSTALTYFMVTKGDDHDALIYGLAALICLTPIAYVIDLLFRRRDTDEHHGFAGVILGINAFFVFISGLAGLITAVIATLMLVIDTGDATTKQIVLIVAIVFAVLNAILFIRIMSFGFAKRFISLFPYLVIGLSIITIVLAGVGPVAHAYQSRADRILEDQLPNLNQSIQDYYASNGALPNSLTQLDLTSEENSGKDLVTSKLVTYTKVAPYQGAQPMWRTRTGGPIVATEPTYQLCVTYKASAGTGHVDSSSSDGTYLYTGNHPAGLTCYTETTTYQVGDNNTTN